MDKISKALKYISAGDYKRAKPLLFQAIGTDRSGDAAYNLAALFHHEGAFGDALTFAETALKQNPAHPFALLYLGKRHLKDGCFDMLRAVLARLPRSYENDPDAVLLRCALLAEEGSVDEAEHQIKVALNHYTDWGLRRALALLYVRQKRSTELVHLLDKVVTTTRQDESERLLLLAEAHLRAGRRREGCRCLEQHAALVKPLRPQVSDTLSLIHQLIRDIGPYYADMADLETARATAQEALPALSRTLDTLKDLTWTEISLIWEHFIRFTGFYLAYLQMANDREIQEALTESIRALYRQMGIYSDLPATSPERERRRIGLASEHMGLHVTKWLLPALEEIAEGHDCDVYLIALGGSTVHMTTCSAINHLSISAGDSLGQLKHAITRIRDLQLDLLIWSDVGMGFSSRHLATFRLAKAQWVHWGHPVTTGSDTIDKFITGELMEPDAGQSQYTEQLLYMPGTGAIHPIKPANSPACNTHAKAEVIRIVSIQSNFKYLPCYDQIFIDVLRRIETATLTFILDEYDYSAEFIQRMRLLAKGNGIEESRIGGVARMNREAYEEFLKTADLAIDSVGWSGGNTTIDCLLAGLPVLTLPKASMRSRHSSAILEILGRPNWILADMGDFPELIKELLSNPPTKSELALQTVEAMTKMNLEVKNRFVAETKRATR